MFRYFIFFLFYFIISNASADNKEKIISNLKSVKNFNFDFEQNINGKIEKGNCTIEYPKKIFCKYNKLNKILVSNGKSLVIKTKVSYYRYALDKTPLNFILDKNFLIKKILKLDENLVDNNLINFTFLENESKINIFFNNKTFDLVGWRNIDIYQNSNITYLYSIKKNGIISKNLFKIPFQN